MAHAIARLGLLREHDVPRRSLAGPELTFCLVGAGSGSIGGAALESKSIAGSLGQARFTSILFLGGGSPFLHF